MANQRDRRRREAERDRVRRASQARAARARRQRRWMAATVAFIVVIGTLGAFIGSRDRSSSSTKPTTTTTASSALPATGVTPTPAAVGATIAGQPPCPAFDGSSPRTTTFGAAPPTCIDPNYFYRATISTSAGRIVEQLNPGVAPQTVNAFVVLALYHYYDGQPVTNVVDRQSFSVGMAFSGGRAQPGFTIASEAPPKGSIPTPGAIGMAPAERSGGVGGQLVFATRDLAANLPIDITGFGIMLDGEDTISTINALASKSGLPVQAVTIESISIERTSAIAR